MDAAAMALLLFTGLSSYQEGVDNLQFRNGSTAGWVNDANKGFYLTTADGRGPGLRFVACSSDNGESGRTAMLYRTIQVPPGAGVLRFSAAAVYPIDPDTERPLHPLNDLNVILRAPGNHLVSMKVLGSKGWNSCNTIKRTDDGKLLTYHFSINRYVGQTLQLALVDDDDRPGCYLVAGNFEIVRNDVFEGGEFDKFMVNLTRTQRLNPVSRYESEHFVAYSNAEESFSELRLQNCEMLHGLFLDHFYRKGFGVRSPDYKMMVAIFDGQAGFEAYLGNKMPAMVTGVYHPGTNRLVVYDYGQNEDFVAMRKAMFAKAKTIRSELDRHRFYATQGNANQMLRAEANIGTVMHEAAHQMSFNTGLLNPEGDMPVWLAEGLACYCEPTKDGVWQGIGEPNPERIQVIEKVIETAGKLKFIPLREFVANDLWLRGPKATPATALIGYAQSWALFRMLMEERPAQLRNYLARLYARRTPEHRFADFVLSFGSDLERLELRYHEYMKDLVRRHIVQR